MKEQSVLKDVTFHSISVTERTEWTFIEISNGNHSCTVEITSGSDTKKVVQLFSELFELVKSKGVTDEADVEMTAGLTADQLLSNQPMAVAVSALRTGLTTLAARDKSVSLIEYLGGESKINVPLYANINRCLLGSRRNPEDFGKAAERVASDGFEVIKCAPFDDVVSGQSSAALLDSSMIGIERVKSVRSAIGPNIGLLVDCHSCFDEESAVEVARKLADFEISWYEEPLPPATGQAELARIASLIGTPVAGGERGYGIKFFNDLLCGGSVSIGMPDVKFCGGVNEAKQIAENIISNQGKVSLHSPSGPISQLASAKVTAAVHGSYRLEHAVYEASWRSEVLIPPERIEKGAFWFPESDYSDAVLNKKLISDKGRSWDI